MGLKLNSVSQPVLFQLQELSLYQLLDTLSPNVPQNLNQNLKPMLKLVMENPFFCLVLVLLQSDQSQSLLDHQLAVSKLNVNAEMSRLKYQTVCQFQKPIVYQPPRLSQDHQPVTMNQDKSVTQSQDKFHSKFQLKNANQSH